jgi:hypothetical protein
VNSDATNNRDRLRFPRLGIEEAIPEHQLTKERAAAEVKGPKQE